MSHRGHAEALGGIYGDLSATDGPDDADKMQLKSVHSVKSVAQDFSFKTPGILAAGRAPRARRVEPAALGGGEGRLSRSRARSWSMAEGWKMKNRLTEVTWRYAGVTHARPSAGGGVSRGGSAGYKRARANY